MKVVVIKEKCLGCGVCESDAPEVFKLGDDSIAIVLLDEIPANLEGAVKLAIEDCPEGAIQIV